MKHMKKVFAALAAAALVLLATSCTSLVPVADNGQFPGDASTYEILGRVTVKSSVSDSGFTKLLKEAKKQYPEADDVVNVKVDRKTTVFLIFVFQSYEMTGIAIDYK